VRKKTLRLGGVRFVVLDEADEMLDMGFAEDLDAILGELPENRQSALFSATLPSRIATIANQHLDDPVRVTIAPRSMDSGTLPKIRQAAYLVRREHKEAALIRLLDVENPTSALIFCRTRLEVEALTAALSQRSFAAQALHGGLTQEQRDMVLKRFKAGALRFLVATDVAARGLHVENLSHVINYDLPVSPEPYVHRIGRTGRAGREGIALSLLDPRELRLLKNIERTTRSRIPLEPLPGPEVLREKRESVLAELVEARAIPRTTAAMESLLKRLTEKTPLEAVASAALAVAIERMFPPMEGDDLDFTPPQRERRPTQAERPEPHRRDAGGPRVPPSERPDGGARRPAFGERREQARTERRGPPSHQTLTEPVKLFISLGLRAGLRPQDVVGAIANEAGVSSRDIGQVEIGDEHTRVEVPAEVSQQVITALRNTTLRGRRFAVDLERERPAPKPGKAAPRRRP
jgi:ATP-dependent RNA helicase DeaD